MGIISRAARNISRRKTRAVLVITALSFALAMLISIPPSITASEAATQKTIDSLTAVAQSVNDTMSIVATQIECRLPLIAVPKPSPNNETIIDPNNESGLEPNNEAFSDSNNDTTLDPNNESALEPNNETIIVQPLMNITEYAANITAIPHVKAIIPIFNQAENDSGFTYSIYGLPLNSASLLETYPMLLPSNITEGRNLEAGDTGVVVLQERVAGYFGVEAGGTVTLLNHTFQVIGIEGYTPLNETVAYMNLNNIWAVTNNTGNATSLKIFADDVYNVEAVAGKISVMFPELSVSMAASLVYSIIQMQTQTNVQLEMAQAIMSQIQSTGMMEISVVTVVAGAIVLFIMLYTVRERTREIGTLKALGAGSGAVLGQFMLEGILLSFIAGIVGTVIGTFGAASFANLLLPAPTQAGNSTISQTGVSIDAASSASISVTITPELVLFGLGVAVLLGALGSLYPAWRAARTRPAEAMRYD
jgi:putative ABC transport system permease protein